MDLLELEMDKKPWRDLSEKSKKRKRL